MASSEEPSGPAGQHTAHAPSVAPGSAAAWLSHNTSFNAAAFQAQQPAPLQRPDTSRHAALLHAAGVLDTSSSDEDSDGGAGPAGDADRRERSKHASTSRKRHSRDDSGDSRDSSRQKHHKTKHKKDKDHSSRDGKHSSRDGRGSSKHKRQRGDLDKILELERRAAKLGMAPDRAAAGPAASAALGGDLAVLDTAGDAQNAVYQSLYAGSVPRYSRLDPLGLVADSRQRYAWQVAAADMERQGPRTDRYFLARHAARERSKATRRVRLAELRPDGHQRQQQQRQQLWQEAALGDGGMTGPRKLSVPPPAFIPFNEQQNGQQQQHQTAGSRQQRQEEQQEQEQQAGETLEEWVMRRTRAWNVAVREHPSDERTWLGFAAWQDDAAQLLHPGRGKAASDAAGGAAEKQVSILQKALEHLPGSQAILMALLGAYGRVAASADELHAKWERVLARNGGWLLWRQYLRLRLRHFGSFKVRRMQQLFGDALQALVSERNAARRQQDGAASAELLEAQLVQLLLALCHMEMQSGHTEQAVARIQALLEFHLLAPPAPPGAGPGTALRSFAAFWDSSAPRLGEEGGNGWVEWARRRAMGCAGARQADEQRQKEQEQEEQQRQQEEQAPGGWGGWFEVPVREQEQERQQQVDVADAATTAATAIDADVDADGQKGEVGEGEEADDAGADGSPKPEVDEIELMVQLGVQLEQDLEHMQAQGISPAIMQHWVAEEHSRSADQWQPQRAPEAAAAEHEDAAGAAEDAEVDYERVVLLEDVESCLFQLSSGAAVRRLVLGCCELLGAPLPPHWCPSNAPTPLQEQQLSTTAAGPHAGDAWGMGDAAAEEGAAGEGPGERGRALLGAMQPCLEPWFAANDARWAFLVRLLEVLVAGPCGRHFGELSVALLAVHAAKPSDATPAASSGAAAPANGDAQQQQVKQQQQQQQQQQQGPSATQLASARAAARTLLSQHRDNLLLWDAYALLEAGAGQLKAARKVYDSAFAAAAAAMTAATGAAAGAAAAAASDALPLLALHCADMECAVGAPDRAHHVLTFLLAGGPYTPYKAAAATRPAALAAAAAGAGAAIRTLPDALLVKARRGFQDSVPKLLAEAGGALSTRGAALVAAAALFEQLSGRLFGARGAGLRSAGAVFSQVAAAVPEDMRRSSAHHEYLALRHCTMLVQSSGSSHVSAISGSQSSGGADAVLGTETAAPGEVRAALATALQLYPRNPALLNLNAQLQWRACTVTRLRRELAAACERCPCPATWAVALRAEALRPSGGGRLRSMLERALGGVRRAGVSVHSPPPLQGSGDDAAGGTEGGDATAVAAADVGFYYDCISSSGSCGSGGVGRGAGSMGGGDCGGCAALWQAYMCLELQQGRGDAARRVFLRAVHECPGDKALWLTGLDTLSGGRAAASGVIAGNGVAVVGGGSDAAGAGVGALAGARELAGLLEALQEREVRCRTDIYEVLLESIEGAPGATG